MSDSFLSDRAAQGMTIRAVILMIALATARYASDQSILAISSIETLEPSAMGRWLLLVTAATIVAIVLLVVGFRVATGPYVVLPGTAPL